jgi:replicative DNA helicase
LLRLPTDTSGLLQDEWIEKAILGSILEKPDLFSKTADLHPEDFASSSHRLIFVCMRKMAEAGEIIDLTMLVTRIACQGDLERVGGAEYVSGLVDGTVHHDLGAYVETLRQSTRRRRLALDLETVAIRAATPSIGTEEIVAGLEKLSATYRDGVAAERKIRFRTAAELAAETPGQVTWLARPWVAAGNHHPGHWKG